MPKRTFALLGDPVSGSLSPTFQNAAMRAAGVLDATYKAIQVPPGELERVLKKIRAGEIAGANVTIPHKTDAFRLVDAHTQVAARVRAVNWIGRGQDGRLTGDNTDVEGFRLALAEAKIRPSPEGTVVVFGAGGAARAAALSLHRNRYSTPVIVGARDLEAAKRLAIEVGGDDAMIEARPLDAARRAAETAEAVISAVPAEAWNDVAPAGMAPKSWLIDIAYRKGGTPAEKWAAVRGIQVLGGLPMLLHQGALSFQRWFGIPFPMEAARGSL